MKSLNHREKKRKRHLCLVCSHIKDNSLMSALVFGPVRDEVISKVRECLRRSLWRSFSQLWLLLCLWRHVVCVHVCLFVCFVRELKCYVKIPPRPLPSANTHTAHTLHTLGQLCMTYFGNLSSWTINIFQSFFLYGIPSMEEMTRQTLGLNVSTLAIIPGQTLIKHEWWRRALFAQSSISAYKGRQ